MSLRNLIACCIYLVIHLTISGKLEMLLYENDTRDYLELRLELFIATALRVILGMVFLHVSKISSPYIFASTILALITRIIFHGPYPMAILACWFYILKRGNRL
jgi:hypothetical protein